jgi:hypothetical protein
MSKTSVIRYQTTPEAAAENRRLIEAVFAQLAERAPSGLRYTALQLEDGVSFVHVVTVDTDTDPLPGLPAFADFRRDAADRFAVSPATDGAAVIGRYDG